MAATPVVEKGTVLVGSRDFSFYAIDAATGGKKWSFKTGGEIYDEAVTHGGNAIFTSSDGFLYAVDVGTGDKKWAFETLVGMKKRMPSAPIVDHGVVYLTNWTIASTESHLYAIDAVSGLAKWTVRTDGGFPSPPRQIDDLIFFSTRRRGSTVVTLHALDASSGNVKWQFDADAKLPDSDPVVAVRDMVIHGTDRGVFALQRETGALRWSRIVTGSEMFGPVNADEGLLYLTSESIWGKLHALDPATGEIKWSSSPGGRIPFGMIDRAVRTIDAIRGDAIYATAPGYLYSLNRETGQVKWSFMVVHGIHARPLFADDLVFISGVGLLQMGSAAVDLGYFYAIDAATGELGPWWRYLSVDLTHRAARTEMAGIR